MKPPVRCVVLRHSPRTPTAKSYVERLPKFGPLERYEMILERLRDIGTNPRILRLGFKSEGGFVNAVQEAQAFVVRMDYLTGKNLDDVKKGRFYKLVGVYLENAFKDYSNEPVYHREHLQRQMVNKKVVEVRSSEKMAESNKKSIRIR